MCGIRQMGAKLVEQGKAPAPEAAPEATPAPAPNSPPIPATAKAAPPSTDMPNAGDQAAAPAAETLQIPAVAPKRSRGFYQTAGARGLNVPGVG